MELKDYEQILDSMPETAVYVIREDNHGILYYNKRVRTVSPEVRPGMTCHKVWTGSCINCPLLTLSSSQEGRSISYNPTFGGVVDMVATRILWQDTTPAFVVTVTPRLESAGYTYRKILRVDLRQDCYDVLKLEPDAWLDGANRADFSLQLSQLAESGAIHPDDRERFLGFIRPEHLLKALQSGKEKLTCMYRRKWKEEFRWNIVEVVKCFDYSDYNKMVIFCVMDVHDTMREGLALEEANSHNSLLLHVAGKQSLRIYKINLADGTAVAIPSNGQPTKEAFSQPSAWDTLIRTELKKLLHPAYRDIFEQKFSIAGLKQAQSAGEQQPDLLCQWNADGAYRYISVTAHPARKPEEAGYIILAFQDMEEQIRRELLHNQRNTQMADILKARYSRMSIVHLDTGQCEQISLQEDDELPPDPLIGDYDYHMHKALYNYVHPDDVMKYSSILSLSHMREKAATVESCSEEVCQYRLKGNPVHWIEQHVIYSRKDDEVTVNILSHDVTSQKTQEEAQMQAMQDKSYIISSLSSLFFSTYYVDLVHDTFRAVAQLGKVGDVLGGEVNCTEALRIYAENFIHPDDRAEYAAVMNIDNWRRSLRWWNPYVTISYRKMPEEPREGEEESCRWVRATAVLAQTDEGDVPRTVVYVAQDITESREKEAQQLRKNETE